MSCMREIWRYARTVDAKNVRLQPSIDYGNVPSAIVGYNSPGSYPGFVIYDTNVPDSTKLYYCLRNTSPYDNYYTTNSSDPLCSGSYTSITEDDYIGYILINDPGTDRYYANWLYNNAGGIYYNQPVKATGLYIMKYSSTGQHYFCGSNQIAGLISQGWCCLRGPSSSCAGNWCGGEENTTPVGYIFIP
ncbi:MAG TPA: hypothetical protein PLD55_02300 [bacterium]|nr:hypothetical protein [bacterium]